MSADLWREIESLKGRLGRLEALDRALGVGARVYYGGGNISIANSTLTTVSFNTERFDTGGFWTLGDPTKLTAPVTGVYLCGFQAYWATAAGGRRAIDILLNGSTAIAVSEEGSVPDGTSILRMNVVTLYPLTAGEYITARVFQASGGALDLISASDYSPQFWMWSMGAQ